VAKSVRTKPKPVLPMVTGVVSAPVPIKPATAPAVVAKIHDPALRDSFLLAARSAELRRDLHQAIKLYRKAVDADPNNYRILTNIAGLNIQLGNFSEALTMAQQALAQRPEFLPALVNGGIAAARLGKDQDAVGSFSQALTIEPTNRGALYNLALLRERSGATVEAAALYRRLMETGDGQGYLGAGRLEEQQRRPAEARRLYHALLALPEVSAAVRGAAKERLQALE
jgi:Tfp pilus assembly protein PilF